VSVPEEERGGARIVPECSQMRHVNQGAGVRPARQDSRPDWSTWGLWVLGGCMVCSPPAGDSPRTLLLTFNVRRGWNFTRLHTLISDCRLSSSHPLLILRIFIMDAVRGIHKRGSGVCRECMEVI
jgi:hypothetical protein